MPSLDHRAKGNEAIKRGDYISAWQHYTEGLQETPKDPYLWCNRAFACLKAGYPELTLHDTANSEAILSDYPEEDFNDINLMKLKFKVKYRMAEAYSALGIPKHAAVEYNACIDLANKDPSMKTYNKSDLDMWTKKKEKNYKTSLLHDQFLQVNGMHQLTEQQKRHGFYKFEERYPWDKSYEERTSEEMMEKLQQKLDSTSNNNLLKIAKVNFDSSEHFGIFVKDSVPNYRIIFQEDPFLPAHNYYILRCDYCFHELKDPNPPNSYYQPRSARADRDVYNCPKRNCKEVFCSQKCYKSALNLYHKALCSKDDDIQVIIDWIHSDNIGVLHHLMLTVRIFAVAKLRDICPLDIEEIKHFSRFTPVSAPYKGKMIYDPLFYDIYIIILRILEISKFDLRYDYWIFITVMNLVMPNTFPGPGESDSIDTSVLYQLSSLFNHNCAPNLLDAQYLS